MLMKKNVTGMMVNYYCVCRRKLWLFANDLSMEENSEDVYVGHIIDESFYSREEKHINIDNVINIDFIDKALLHEVKKSRSIEEASILQVKYYLYYLKKRGVTNLTAQINYPLLKETLKIELDDSDERMLEDVCSEIQECISLPKPPAVLNSKICNKCAYYELCYI